MDEVTVISSKFDEQTKDVPHQILQLTKADIIQSNQLNSADVLQQTGQIFVQKSQLGGGSPIIRGFEANKVLLVIDGVRMNNAIYRSGHLHNVIRINPHLLDNVEIIFGSGSVIYGSDALGGVMHFTTLKPSLSRSKKAINKSVVSTSFHTVSNSLSTHFQTQVGFEKMALLTGVTFSSFGDLRQGNIRNSDIGNLGIRDSFQMTLNAKDYSQLNLDNALQTPSGYNQLDVLQKVLYQPNAHWEYLLNIHYSNSGNVPRYDRLTEINPKTNQFRFAEWYYGNELRTLVSLQVYHKQATYLYDEWKTVLAFQHLKESRHNRLFDDYMRINRYETVQVYTLNSDARKTIGKHDLKFGIDFAFNEVQSEANRQHIITNEVFGQTTRYPDGGSNVYSLAFYANNTWNIHDKYKLIAGIRYNYVHLSSQFIDVSFLPITQRSMNLIQQNNAQVGHLGIVYIPTKNWRYYLQLSSAFRAPNVDDVGKVFESAAGAQVVIPNPNLNPENSYNAELGFNIIPKEYIRWDFALWYTFLTNGITLKQTKLNEADSILYFGQQTKVVQQQNVQQALLYGFYTKILIEPTSWLSLSNQVSYTYGRILTTPNTYPLDHIPPIFGKSTCAFMFNKFSTDFFILYNGTKLLKDYNLFGEDNYQYATKNGVPAWYTFNAKCSYHLPIKNRKSILLVAGIENILDVNYRIFASGISAPGRNFHATVRYSF
jgi:hemoglobin/transferrin/lactoferrin receptor protein